MDDRQGDRGEEEKSGMPEGFEEDREGNGGEQAVTEREGEDRSEDGGSRKMRKERKEMELASFGSSPDGAVRRFLEGELVEVRQREKGLRGSWHPAVVIRVKPGRRLVVYDELLTDDGREKLTENIPVGKCLDGGRFGASRQPWKSHAKRPRTLLRPRPPPLPDPSSINWSKGLSVDCHFQDAWWEGVLTEAISSSSRQKRASVWFPEEEDWAAMPLKDMRVGQQWDEDTGAWSLKGCVDVPSSKKVNRSRTMSLNQKSKGFARNRQTRSSDSMDLSIALKIDGTSCSGRDVEYTSARDSVERTKEDPSAVISVQLNSPKSIALTPRQDGTDRPSRDFLKQQKPVSTAVRTLRSDWVQRQLRTPRGRGAGRPSPEEIVIAASVREDGEDQERIVNSGQMVDKEILDDDKKAKFMEESGSAVKDAVKKLGHLGLLNSLPNVDILNNFSPVDVGGVTQLLVAGWSIVLPKTKRESQKLLYRSPNGCLLGSLASALGMCERMNENTSASGDDENPTLREILSPKSGKGLPVSKGRFGSGRTLKGSRRIASPTSVKEGGREMDLTELSNAGHVNGKLVSNLGLPAFSNGIVRSSSASATVSLLAHMNSKRNSMDSEFILDDSKLIELKRRKVQDSPVERNGPSSLLAFLSNGSLIQRSEGIARAGPSVEKASFTDSTGAGINKFLDDGGPATETRSKKRACLTEGIKREQGNGLLNTRSTDDWSPFRDGSIEYEPKTKKSKVVTEVSTPSEGKSKKSLAILQESSRKKGYIPYKCVDSKQPKKGTPQKKSSAVKKGKKSRTPARAGVRLEVLLSAPGSNQAVAEGELRRKRTLLSWLIDNGTVSEHEKVRYLHRIDLHCMNEGYVTRDGVMCNCCKKIVTLSVFEAHAGSKLHRPSANIFLEDGRSLSVCQVEALQVQQGQAEESLGDLDKSDDTCGICGDGGELICCDHCPSTFHITCMGLQRVPDGDWYCPNCRCASCGDSQFNGDKTTFNDLTVVFCDQCECEYHVKCLRSRGLSLTSLPQQDFFCGDSCGKIFQGLRNLVGICKPMEGGFSWTLLRSAAEDDRKSGCITNTEINAEHDSKLSIALSVMQECFRPMIDPRTKIDIITHVLYNKRSDVSRLNYYGFYTMLLERGDELISVATVRVHGARLAELPLIGTRFTYRRQGMCRRLMSAIEEMLHSLGVERLVLPAVPELLETWTGAFGFKPMDESERLQLMDLNIMAFPGTSILYKRLDNVALRCQEARLPNLDQSRYAQVGEPRLPMDHLGASLASPRVVAKRGRGRPPKSKEESTNWINGLAHALPEAIAGQTTRHAQSPVASQHVTVKRGRGRPPKNSKGLFVSTAIVGAHKLAEADCDAGYTCSPSQGFLGQGFLVSRHVKDGGHEEQEEVIPTVLRRKRGRPPRARMTYNPGTGVLTTATSIQPDEVAEFHEGRARISSSAGMGATQFMFPERFSEGRFASAEERRHDALVPKTTRSIREVKTPMWLVETVNTLPRESTCKALGIEGPSYIPPLECAMIGSTRTYERRKGGLSPPYQADFSRMQHDGSDIEPMYGHRDFFYEDDPAEFGLGYEAVSVPIRTFPSQFAGHNNPVGTFIPVETIVVNSGPKVETLNELLVPGREVSSRAERGEQRSGGKLLLRLKLPKKKMSPDHLELPQQSPMAIKLANRGLLPPAFTAPDPMGKEVNRFEQCDQEQLQQPESTIGSHCIPVPVS